LGNDAHRLRPASASLVIARRRPVRPFFRPDPKPQLADRLNGRESETRPAVEDLQRGLFFQKLMTARSLAVVSIVLVIGTVSPSAAGTKVISGAFQIPASPASAGDLDELEAGSTSNGASALPANTEAAEPGIDALEPARMADPPYSGLQGMLNTILQLAPAASH
jgi:hypothetical protein